MRRHAATAWRVTCLAALLLLLPAAQGLAIEADPVAATAPAQIHVALSADAPSSEGWRVIAIRDDGNQTVAVGAGLPTNRSITLAHAGTHTLRFIVDDGSWAETVVDIASNAAGTALETLALRVEGMPPMGHPFPVHIDNAVDVNASWSLLLVAGGQTIPIGAGSHVPATVNLTIGEQGGYGLRLLVDADGQAIERSADFDVGPRAYSHVIAGDVFPLLFAGLLMLGLAVWILVLDRSRPINLAFAALFIARGVADLVLALWANTGSLNVRPGEGLDLATGGLARHLHPVTSVLVLFAALYFLYAYLAQNNARLAIRHRVMASYAGIGAALLVALYFLVPSIWWETAPLRPGGWLFAITGIYYPLYAVFALLLFRESVKDIPDDRRAGAFYSGLGFLFLPVFTGAGELLFVDVLDFFGRIEAAGGISRASLGAAFELGHWAAVLALIPVVWAGVVLRRDAVGNPQRAGSRSHFRIYVLAVTLPLLSLMLAATVFFVGSDDIAAAARALSVFNIFQGIWTIPYPVLVAYGLTRYQASSEQLRMRQQIRRFGLASVFFTIFFGVSEGLEAFASSRFGSAVGLASAAGLTLLLGPLQQRLQKTVVDHQAAPDEQTPQEIRFYTEQVRRTLLDGFIGDVERKFLLNLQDTMGIKPETAAAIEAGLVAERQAAGLVAAAT